jgi:hypothetical protein
MQHSNMHGHLLPAAEGLQYQHGLAVLDAYRSQNYVQNNVIEHNQMRLLYGMWNVVGAVGILSVAITHMGPSFPTRAPTPGLGLSHKLPCDHPARHLYHLPRLPASR